MFLLARPVIYKENNKETRAMWWVFLSCQITEAANRRGSIKEVFLKVSQKSQENTCTKNLIFNKNFCPLFYIFLPNYSHSKTTKTALHFP